VATLKISGDNSISAIKSTEIDNPAPKGRLVSTAPLLLVHTLIGLDYQFFNRCAGSRIMRQFSGQ
jgi:hypothetical protein